MLEHRNKNRKYEREEHLKFSKLKSISLDENVNVIGNTKAGNVIGIYANRSPLLATFVVAILDEFSIATMRSSHSYVRKKFSFEGRKPKQTRLCSGTKE